MVLQVSDLNVTYISRQGSAHVVKDMSFEVGAAQIVALVGESGSGKSAAIHAIARLPRPVQATITGRALLDGEDLLGLPPKELRHLRGTSLGFVGQNPFGCLHPTLRVAKQFHNVLRVHGRTGSRKESNRIAAGALDSVGIPDAERVLAGYAHQLSGGMAQRAAIAMATMLHPKLLIADEPTTALDPTVQIQILDLLVGLQTERQMSILIVTHDLGVVASYCQSAMVMKSGELVERGTVAQLFSAPEHPYTRELFRDETPLAESA